MKNLLSLKLSPTCGAIEFSYRYIGREATYLVTDKTAEKILKLSEQGYTILVGNNYRMDKTTKWKGYDVVRVSQVNSRKHRHSIRTIWAYRIF